MKYSRHAKPYSFPRTPVVKQANSRAKIEDKRTVPPLRNVRHEKFCLELAKGQSAHQAYVNAGFKPSRQNAGRLRTRDDITARVLELQQVSADACKITVESICAELDAAIAVARQRGAAQPMVSAAALRAKLAGLGVENSRIAITQEPSEFEQAQSAAEVLARVEADMGVEAAAKLAYLFDIEYTAPTPEQARAVASVKAKMLEWKP